MKLDVILLLIWIHFIADFVFQSDEMALNKSHSNMWLLFHSMAYSFCFLWMGIPSLIFIFISHFMIDYVSSRGTTELWIAQKRHWFFCLIGFDQGFHLSVLAFTYFYIMK